MKKSIITMLLLFVFTALFSQSNLKTAYQKKVEVLQINLLKDLGMSPDEIILISKSKDFQQILAIDIILSKINTENGKFALLKFSQELEKAKELKTSVDFKLERDKQELLANKEKQKNENQKNKRIKEELERVLREEESDKRYGRLNISVPENVKKVRLNKYETDYEYSDGLLAVKNGNTDKWGFIDEEGNIAIDFLWFSVSKFNNGIATVAKLIMKDESKNQYQTDSYKIEYYLIDKKGNIISKEENANFENETPKSQLYFDGLAKLFDINKNRCGFKNINGKIIIPPIFITAQNFNEGLAAVLVENENNGTSKWGFIDVNGELIIPAIFNKQPTPFCHGYSSVIKSDGSVVMIDKNGKVASPIFRDILNFHNGIAIAHFKDKQYACLVDTNFNIVKEELEGLELSDYSQMNHIFGPVDIMRGELLSWKYDLKELSVKSDGLWKQDDVVFDYMGNLKVNLKVNSITRSRWDESKNDYVFYTKPGYSIDCKNKNLLHCVTFIDKDIEKPITDGFIDYNGNYVFIFCDEEF